MDTVRAPATTEQSLWCTHLDRVRAPAITRLPDLPREYRAAIDKGYSTGWRCLDRYLQGIRAGEVTVITADTGAGKTTFATQLLINVAEQGVPVWVNSWEMRPEVTLRKIASVAIRRPMKLIDFSEDDNVAFDAWAQSHAIYINQDTIGSTIDTLTENLVRAESLGVKCVMLDHLDYLVNFNREKLHEAIDATIKRLHELAFSLRMHFLLICHPRQGSGADDVGLHSIKGSSSIKQYADNILILHRTSRSDKKAPPTELRVTVAKNRMFGVEGSANLYYQPWDGYLE